MGAMKRTQNDMAIGDASAAVASSVLCCSCGVPMVPNQSMRCAQCLKSEVSIVEEVSRNCVLPHCRTCERYNKPGWTKAEPESRELLGICLKRIRGIGKDVRLVDASFIWTEEHSKRIKVKITVQKEVANSSVLQQSMVVEFQVVNQQCEDCQKSFTPHTFNAIVQVRQKVEHRRTFCYLEQLILKHDAHEKVVSLKENNQGLDFHFAQRSHAQRFADFVDSWVPAKAKLSKHLVSHDANSNVYNYKYTILQELCPICVDDVVVVPKGHSAQLSGCPPLMLCHKVSTSLRLVCPLTLRGCDIPATEYWKRPIESCCSRRHLTEFVVLNVERIEQQESAASRAKRCAKWVLADIEVAKAADFGVNDERIIVRSHLGHILKPGNRALGYDLRTLNLSGLDTECVDQVTADIFLVKKHYKRRRGKRNWDLRRLEREQEEGAVPVDDEDDMEAVRQDLEEDAELRKGVNMFAEHGARGGAEGADEEDEEDDEDENAPEVPLAELLQGLELRDDEADGASTAVASPAAA